MSFSEKENDRREELSAAEQANALFAMKVPDDERAGDISLGAFLGRKSDSLPKNTKLEDIPLFDACSRVKVLRVLTAIMENKIDEVKGGDLQDAIRWVGGYISRAKSTGTRTITMEERGQAGALLESIFGSTDAEDINVGMINAQANCRSQAERWQTVQNALVDLGRSLDRARGR